MRDLHNNLKPIRVLSPIALTTTIAAAVPPVNVATYQGCEFILSYGTRTTTGASVTPVMKECSTSNGSFTSVADADMLGTEAAAGVVGAASLVSGTHKNVVTKIGYIGNNKWVKLLPTPAGSTSFICGVTAILGKPTNAPVA